MIARPVTEVAHQPRRSSRFPATPRCHAARGCFRMSDRRVITPRCMPGMQRFPGSTRRSAAQRCYNTTRRLSRRQRNAKPLWGVCFDMGQLNGACPAREDSRGSRDALQPEVSDQHTTAFGHQRDSRWPLGVCTMPVSSRCQRAWDTSWGMHLVATQPIHTP